jgi:hypothetical protein
MCPDPALLAAYVDGTLFHRDVDAVERHVAGCAACSALVASLRQQRESAGSSIVARWWKVVAAASVVAAIFVAAVLVTGGGDEPTTTSAPESAAAAATSPAVEVSTAPASEREAAPAAPSSPVPPPRPQPSASPLTSAVRRADTTQKPPTAPVRAAAPARPAAAIEQVAEPAVIDGDLVLRGRNADRRILWRVRDRTIEHSTDGGTTWVTEHTSDRAIRAGAFVSASVAWMVGESGLILRRTSNGWFGATPPADGHIQAVRASSPSRATITFEDGRAFSTENGGVTWGEAK